jgi:hypothetical protein
MAWMITAGNGTKGQGAGVAGLSIASNDERKACGWRFVSGNGHSSHVMAPGVARVWQDVLAQLTAE